MVKRKETPMSNAEMITAYILKSLWWIIPTVTILIGVGVMEKRNGD